MSRFVIAIAMSMALAACGGAGGDGGDDLHTLGGSIGGLTASGLVLANGDDTRSVSAGATRFTLPIGLAAGSSFDVIVKTQPVGQTCSVAGGRGTMGGADVTSVAVTCGTNGFTLGGGISGLTSGGLVLANGSDTLSVAANDTAFTLRRPLTAGSSFAITVRAQPAGLTCSVANGSGVIGNANVNNAVVTCSVHAFTLGGSISGLNSSGLVLANGGDTLIVGAGATLFTFPGLVALGSSFEVTVRSQPIGQACSVAGGSGIVGAADVANVEVTCSPNAFTLGGSISGLASSGLVLANGSDTLLVAANENSFRMPTAVASGSAFNVTVQIQADEEICTVSNGSGIMGGADVSGITIACLPVIFTVSTFAGSATMNGSTDGIGTAASFSSPVGIAFDSAGNLYVSDLGNQNIRKITPEAVVGRFAGSGVIGSADGSGATASFNNPSGIAVDGSGNIYVADESNHKIRKITAAGVVSTFAGSGAVGSADGTGEAASFNRPQDVAIDGSGNLYVADIENHKIRKITPAGVVSTFAGSGAAGSADGSATTASFNGPTGVAVDAGGNVFVNDFVNRKVRKITADGVVSTLAGSGAEGSTDGSGAAASFGQLFGIAVDGRGNLYVGDIGARKVRKITPAGVVSTLAGTGASGSQDGSAATATFNTPAYLAIDSNGNVLVTDALNHTIRRVEPHIAP